MFTKEKWKIYKGAANVSERVPPEGSSLWNIWVVDENNRAVAQIHSDNDADLKATAQLIALAPRMYESLKALTLVTRDVSYTHAELIKAKEVITKVDKGD